MLLLLATQEGPTIGDYEIARAAVEWIETAAIVVILLAVAAALIGGVVEQVRTNSEGAFTTFKRYMARGLLVGLDFLIAADVITTVTLEATLENAVILGLLIVIRTFLSWTLVLELEGRWPWQTTPSEHHPSV